MKLLALVILLICLIYFVESQGFTDESTKQIDVTLEAGKLATLPINIFNPEDSGKEFYFKPEIYSSSQFFTLEREVLYISPKSYGSVNVYLGNQNLNPGVYFGEIEVSNSEFSNKIPVLMSLKSKSADLLFDAGIQLSQNSLFVAPGGSVEADISFYNLKATQPIAQVTYKITDLEGKDILEQKEILSISRKGVKIGKSFILPDNIAQGSMLFFASIEQGYGEKKSYSAASEVFIVRDPLLSPAAAEKDYSIWIGFFVILFLMVSVVLLSYYWNRRVLHQADNWRSRINNIKRLKFSDKAKAISKLNYQRNLLERAYAGNYITKQSYEHGKKEIGNLLGNLKKRL